MKKILLTVLNVLIVFFISAQNEFDALRFSKIYYYGTARAMSLANAFTALGADPGAVIYNPASIALMRKSDYSITPGFKIAQATSTFNSTTKKDLKYQFTVNNFSLVFVSKNNMGAIKNFNFGIIFNRILDFNQRLWIEGVNDKGSMLDDFMYNADGFYPDELNPFNTYLAYDTYLIDILDTASLTYTNPLWIVGGPYYGETQRKIVRKSGSGSSLDFVIGLNFSDFVYFGMSVASISMEYADISEYSEFYFNQAVDLESFKFNENLKNDASGYAVKLGMIFTPIKSIRLGFSLQTPYFLKVDDIYSSSIESHWYTPDIDGNTSYSSTSSLNTYRYNLTSPWRISAGIGFILGKFLAFGVDYEKVDYSTIRMDANDYNFAYENTNIQNNFKSTENIRFGMDLNLSGFHFRGGVARYGAAFERESALNVFSGGVGYRASNFYMDIAVQQSFSSEIYWLYVPYEDEPMPTITYKNLMFAITIGMRL